MIKEQVVLVDENDFETGTMEKIEAHEKGVLHRAFSVFIINSKGELLLQKRALSKYHSPGLLTNTCCSHPRLGENIKDAASRRLMEEMGMSCELQPSFSFIYRAGFDNGLTEHEFDHVLIGMSDAKPNINRDEVEEYLYADMDATSSDLENNPSRYTVWFRIAYPKVREQLINLLNRSRCIPI